jgi:hypothetical protein
MLCGSHELGLGFNRAWASHGDEVVPADFEIPHPHNRLPALRIFQYIRGFGKSCLPTFAHPMRSVPGKIKATSVDHPSHPPKGGDAVCVTHRTYHCVFSGGMNICL